MERLKPAPTSDAVVQTPPTESAIQSHTLTESPQNGSVPPTEPLVEPIQTHSLIATSETVEVFVFPEPTQVDHFARDTQIAEMLAQLRAPYDLHEHYLTRIKGSLPRDVPVETNLYTEPQTPDTTDEIPVVPTILGTLNYEELHQRARKYAAYALHHTYHMSFDDIEDGLQAGCFRLWQRLQEDPILLKDKEFAWIGRMVIYEALHETRGDWKARKYALRNGDGATRGQYKHSGESRQIDMRVDIHGAIGLVAERILTDGSGKRSDHDLWALYGLTMLHTSASETSRFFGVREQSMQAAYKRVRQWLQEALPNYAPPETTTVYSRRGRESLPKENIAAIRSGNKDVSDEVYESVKNLIATLDSDTQRQDEAALEGIRRGYSAARQARTFGITQAQMQRAYARVHLMIGAERDPSIRIPRPERRMKHVFALTDETALAVERLASDLLQQPKSYEKLVALHAHIANLPISTTAKNFKIPTSTLRYYAKQIGNQLGTPLVHAREERE